MAKLPTYPAASRPLRIGILYDLESDYEMFVAGTRLPAEQKWPGQASETAPADLYAEFEPESTILAMEQAILLAGFRPVRLGSPLRLLKQRPDIDLVWNISEGLGTRNREAWGPVLCEMLGLPCLGSDAWTLTLSLDKALCKTIARNLEIPTADWKVIPRGSNLSELCDTLPDLPVFLKPRYEGSGKGLSGDSIVRDKNEFVTQCRYLMHTYKQDVLVEPFLPGPELTCALARHPLQAMPVLERGLRTDGIGSHILSQTRAEAHASELQGNETTRISGILNPALENKLSAWSMKLCNELRVKDYARLDFKCSRSGDPFFLEINPLPTFSLESTYAILAELEGVPYPEYLSRILRPAVHRLLDPCQENVSN